MVVSGVYWKDGKRSIYPDIGYSFCNCKNIFYTRYENIDQGGKLGFSRYKDPIREIKSAYDSLLKGGGLEIIAPDIFFVDWGQSPYDWMHWNPRTNHILWNMDVLADECRAIGFEVVKAEHVFDVDTEHPKHMKIVLRKP